MMFCRDANANRIPSGWCGRTGAIYNGDEAGRQRSKRPDRGSFAALLAAYIGLSAAAVVWY